MKPTSNLQSGQDLKMVVLNIRVEASLRKAFQQCCTQNDNTASRVLRDAMRLYVLENNQMDLLPKRKRKA